MSKKKIITILLLSGILSLSSMFIDKLTIGGVELVSTKDAYASTVIKVNGVNYTDYGSYVYVSQTQDSSLSGSITLEETVNGKPVTGIESYAFSSIPNVSVINISKNITYMDSELFYNNKLTAVNVDSNNTAYASDNGVLYRKDMSELIYYPVNKVGTTYTVDSRTLAIDSMAFSDNVNLVTVVLPEGLTSIQYGAFSWCKNLVNINLPSTLTSIGQLAFSYSHKIKDLTIPQSTNFIATKAFMDCQSLTKITVDSSNANFKDIDGVLFSKDGKRLLAYPAGKSDTNYSLPSTVTNADEYSMTYNTHLQNVVIPDSVTSLGQYMFYECSALKSAVISKSVTALPDGLFSEASSLLSIDIPSSVTNIGDFCFNSASSLISVNIPNSVTRIGRSAFSSCHALTSIVIPDSVTQMLDHAFNFCESLTSVTLSKGLTNLATSVFETCYNLETITIPDNITSISSKAFSYARSLGLIKLPAGCTNVAHDAFYLDDKVVLDVAPNFSSLSALDNFYDVTFYDEDDSTFLHHYYASKPYSYIATSVAPYTPNVTKAGLQTVWRLSSRTPSSGSTVENIVDNVSFKASFQTPAVATPTLTTNSSANKVDAKVTAGNLVAGMKYYYKITYDISTRFDTSKYSDVSLTNYTGSFTATDTSQDIAIPYLDTPNAVCYYITIAGLDNGGYTDSNIARGLSYFYNAPQLSSPYISPSNHITNNRNTKQYFNVSGLDPDAVYYYTLDNTNPVVGVSPVLPINTDGDNGDCKVIATPPDTDNHATVTLKIIGRKTGNSDSGIASGSIAFDSLQNYTEISSALIHFDSVPSVSTKYTVTFIDYNGHVIDTQQVDDNGSAVYPTSPSRDGYNFTGWDKTITNITSDLTVTAQYSKIDSPATSYTVVFEDYNDSILSSQSVTSGDCAIEPTHPTRDGYTFVGWDTNFTNVVSNLVVKAKYTLNTPTTPNTPSTGSNSGGSSSNNTASDLIKVFKEQDNTTYEYSGSKNTTDLVSVPLDGDTGAVYNWKNTTEGLTGQLIEVKPKDDSESTYIIKLDQKPTDDINVQILNVVNSDNAKLYSHVDDIDKYALIADNTKQGENVDFKTTRSTQYIVSPKDLPQDHVVNGWYKLDTNKWEYYDKYKDEKTIGWHTAYANEWTHNGKDIEGDRFHLNNQGVMDYGWYQDQADKGWYYLDDLDANKVYGGTLNGWYYLNNNWYYFNKENNSKMVTGWSKINNKWYYFDENGHMLSDTFIDGYKLNEHGELV